MQPSGHQRQFLNYKCRMQITIITASHFMLLVGPASQHHHRRSRHRQETCINQSAPRTWNANNAMPTTRASYYHQIICGREPNVPRSSSIPLHSGTLLSWPFCSPNRCRVCFRPKTGGMAGLQQWGRNMCGCNRVDVWLLRSFVS